MASNYVIDDSGEDELIADDDDDDVMRIEDEADIEDDDILEDEDENNRKGAKKQKTTIIKVVPPPIPKQQHQQQKEKLPQPQHPISLGKTSLETGKLELGAKIDRICEFAHVLMHCLLYKINFYDRKTHFSKAIKYDIIVYKCKSDMVCEYINNCIECMRLLLYEKYNLDTDDSNTTSTGITGIGGKTKRENKLEDTFSIGLALLKIPNDADSTVLENDGEKEEPTNLLIRRYTLQIECLDSNVTIAGDGDSLDEWNFRDSLLKYYKWQIQIRTNKSTIQKMNSKDDLFKLFAWRQCDKEEITSIKTRSSSYNPISIKPVKTMNLFNKMRVQLFIEQSIQTTTSK